MNLAQMYALANSKSGYTRSDAEIYDALNESGFRVYSAVLKEFSGFFLKFDETSLTLAPDSTGKNEYTLPSDLTQIVHLAERSDPTQNWRPMSPANLNDALMNTQQNVGWELYENAYGSGSQFMFYGPYLDSTATTGVQTQKIRVSPNPDQNYACQIAYTAKWLPITDASSSIMMPDEGTYSMLNFAIAELRRASDDSLSADYEQKGETHLSAFLSWLRARQTQSPLTIATYGPDCP